MLYTTKEDLDSFSLFGSPTKPNNTMPVPVYNQPPNYNALYTHAPNPGYNNMYAPPQNLMYSNNMGMNMNQPPVYNQFPNQGFPMQNQGFPPQNQYNNTNNNNNNVFNFN